MKQRVLILISLAAVSLTGLMILAVVTYDGRALATRIRDCEQRAGYTADVYHDDGRVPADDPDIALLFGDGDGMVQVRPPSDRITVSSRVGIDLATIKVSEDGSINLRFAPGRQRKGRSVAACVPEVVNASAPPNT